MTIPELNKARTAGIVVATAVLVGYVLVDVLNVGATDTTDPTPPDPGAPLIGISVPW